MRNVSDTICRESSITYFMLNNFFFFENHAVYEKMWKNIVDPDMPQMTMLLMRIVCWVPNATNTHSEYVILIAFVLRCTTLPASFEVALDVV
jgi:hypothetical protein